MHSLAQRAQNIFSFFTSAAFAVAAVVALSVFIIPQTPQAGLQLRNVQVVKGRPHYYSTKREEYAHVRFDLDADLTSLFHWNTKQVFLYITATYPSDSPETVPPSELVIWDAVIPAANAPEHPNTFIHPLEKGAKKPKKTKGKQKRLPSYPAGGSPGILRLPAQKPKYQITDISGTMAERANATLTLKWNVQPWVGALFWTNRNTYGYWQALQGGESAPFDFPPLKASEVKKEDIGTATGAEYRKGSPR